MQHQNVNRAEQLWENWEKQQKELKSFAGLGNDNSLTIQQLKYDFLRHGLYRLSASPLEKEQLCLHVIRSVTAKLEKQLYPNLLIRTLYRLKALVYDKPAHLKMFNKQKAENIVHLTRQLKVFGFASFTGKLGNYLDYERMNISIPMTTQLSDKGCMDIDLKLERDQAGNYRCTEYQACLYKDGELQHSYTFPAESKITAIEAANLLEGRAVSKSYLTADESISQKWVQLDFSRNEPKLLEFHPVYSYDLKKELMTAASGLAIDGLGREEIMKNLEKGNLIGLEIPGKGYHSLYADPANRSVGLLDADKRTVKLSALIEEIKEVKAKVLHPEIKLHKEQEKHQQQNHSLVID